MTEKANTGNGRGRQKGFTLVEVIVVLVILAVLAALLIPSMVGWIDKAHKRTCEVSKAGLARDLQAEEIYQTEGGGKLTTSQLQELAQTSEFYCKQGGVYHVLRDGAGEIQVVCPLHDSAYTFDMSEVIRNLMANPGSEELKALFQSFTGAGKYIDSTSKQGTNREKLEGALKEAGFDLQAQGVQSWSFQGVGSGQFLLYWTTESLADYPVGSQVKVMRYNSRRGTYTAGYVTVQETQLEGKGEYYPVLGRGDASWSEFTDIPQSDADKQQFDAIYQVFGQMPAGAN